MNLRVTMSGEVKFFWNATAVKARLKRPFRAKPKAHFCAFELDGVDAKPSDLHMSRVKSR